MCRIQNSSLVSDSHGEFPLADLTALFQPTKVDQPPPRVVSSPSKAASQQQQQPTNVVDAKEGTELAGAATMEQLQNPQQDSGEGKNTYSIFSKISGSASGEVTPEATLLDSSLLSLIHI